jgi:hypothetical protein
MARLTNKQSDDNGRKASSPKAVSPPARPEDAGRPANEIPKFDLAEQILAEQRKLASVKRKGPRKRTKAPATEAVKPVARTIESPTIPSEQEQIIAEIVAGDIEELVAGAHASEGE